MFKSVGWTWNPIAGCTHDCKYCWAKSLTERWGKTFEPKIREHFFKDKMPNDGSWIFVGSVGDTFCRSMKDAWILRLLKFIKDCKANNKFLLQTKNPNRFPWFINELEEIKDKIIVGTTLETTWATPWSNAPPTDSRADYLIYMKKHGFKTFLSLEPLADFQLVTMKRWINLIQPEAIEIGLENYTNFTFPPTDKKILSLLRWLEDSRFEYVLKENLKHLTLSPPICPECGYDIIRAVYKDDEGMEIDFYDCTGCSHVWKPYNSSVPTKIGEKNG